MQRRIGLTGGIATGKTTVSNYLAQHHKIPVLDADVFAREAVMVGSPILAAIATRYGSDILQADGSLDRSQLGQVVFTNESERRWLEAQIHPYVRDRFQQSLAEYPEDATIVCAIPLLFEAELTHLVSEIWVVACGATQQLARLQARNHLDVTAAQQRIDAQMSLTEKCARADVVLDNSRTLPALYEQVDAQISPSALAYSSKKSSLN